MALGGVALTGDLGGGTTTVVRTSAFPRGRRSGRRQQQAVGSRDLFACGTRRRPDHVNGRHRGYAERRPVRLVGATGAGTGLGLRDRQGGPHRHELPRDRGRRPDRGQLLEPGHAARDARRQRPLHRYRRASCRRELAGPDPARVRRLGVRARRRSRRRDRQPVRARTHRDRRDRQRRSGAHDHCAERLSDRSRDPDRRADQPRQLGWPAAERARAGDRRQLPDLDCAGRERQRRHRLRRAFEHGQGGRGSARS